MQKSLNVAKFGGTSVANYAAIKHCVKIVVNNPNTRVVVVSAAAGVTNQLVLLANTPLSSAQITELIDKIRTIELAILNELKNPSEVRADTTPSILMYVKYCVPIVRIPKPHPI